MAVAPDTGMDKAELKRLLGTASAEPVSCAVGVAADTTGLILVHKSKGPKALHKELMEKFPKAKAIRWGTAKYSETDKLLTFQINKAAPGLEKSLLKTMKGTGYEKFEITFDEAEGEETEAEGATATDTAPETGTDAKPEIDLAALNKELGGCIKQLAAASNGDADRMSALKALAVEANAAIKAEDGEKAQDAIARLKAMLNEGAATGGTSSATPTATKSDAPAAPVSFVKMQKSRLLWDAARKRTASEIDAFKKAVLAEFEGDPEEAKVMDALDQLDDITAYLDDSLLDALDALLSEQDATKHAALLQDAKDTLAGYVSFIQSNELINKLSGDTPFGVKLTIGPTLTSTMKALQESIH
jgi:phosphotransferase system HPr-like phosphotransfer protein